MRAAVPAIELVYIEPDLYRAVDAGAGVARRPGALTSVAPMSITAVVNQKGGVGKTTVTLGLAAAASARGRRGARRRPRPAGERDAPGWACGTAGAHHRRAPWSAKPAAPSRRSCSRPSGVATPRRRRRSISHRARRGSPQCEHQLATDVIGAQDRLAVALVGVADRYDDVFIDCAPSLGLLTVNALFAADRVLIVAEPAAWSSDGVEQILRNVSRISERRAGRPVVAGIIVNRLGRTRDAAYWHGQLVESHPDLVLDPPVRLRAAVAEAAAQSVPVGSLTRDGAAEAAAEFDALSRRLDPDPAPSEPAVDPVPSNGHVASAERPTAPTAPTVGLTGPSPVSDSSQGVLTASARHASPSPGASIGPASFRDGAGSRSPETSDGVRPQTTAPGRGGRRRASARRGVARRRGRRVRRAVHGRRRPTLDRAGHRRARRRRGRRPHRHVTGSRPGAGRARGGSVVERFGTRPSPEVPVAPAPEEGTTNRAVLAAALGGSLLVVILLLLWRRRRSDTA